MTGKITEVFTSIQGEGKYIGVQQIFVRFFGCSLDCQWCDSEYAARPSGFYNTYEVDPLMMIIRDFKSRVHSVCLTGGEPLEQVGFIERLLFQLKKENYPVYLETNGVLPKALKKIITLVDYVAMDLKMPSSTGQKAFWTEHEHFIEIAQTKDLFIKTVVSMETTEEDMQKCVLLVKRIDARITFIIQPDTFALQKGVWEKCLRMLQLALPHLEDVRVVPQIHPLLGIR